MYGFKAGHGGTLRGRDMGVRSKTASLGVDQNWSKIARIGRNELGPHVGEPLRGCEFIATALPEWEGER